MNYDLILKFVKLFTYMCDKDDMLIILKNYKKLNMQNVR